MDIQIEEIKKDIADESDFKKRAWLQIVLYLLKLRIIAEFMLIFLLLYIVVRLAIDFTV